MKSVLSLFIFILIFYQASSTRKVASFPKKLPTFKWMVTEKSSFGIPLLNLRFPDGNEDDFAILRQIHPESGISKDCILEGHLRFEENVDVKITGGCPFSKSFKITFHSKRTPFSSFKISDGVNVKAILDDLPTFRHISETFTSSENNCNSVQLPENGFVLRIKAFYDQSFKLKFDQTSKNIVRAIIDKTIQMFVLPSLITTFKIDLVDIEEIPNSIVATENDLNLMASNFIPNSNSFLIDAFVFFADEEEDFEQVTGISFSHGICSPLKKSKAIIVEWTSSLVNTAKTVAHELGHLLGMKHDFLTKDGTNYNRYDIGHRKCSNINGIMDYTSERSLWSSCSVQDFTDYFVQESRSHNFCLEQSVGIWSDWEVHGSCSVSCGGGTQLIERTCLTLNESMMACEGPSKMEVKCNLNVCTAGVQREHNENNCLVTGECINSFSIGIIPSNDEFECLDLCNNQDFCEWFTFFPKFKACQLFRDCSFVNDENCPDCMSSQKGCHLEKPKCWIQGECEGKSLGAKHSESEMECLKFYNSDRGCKWFTFLQPGNACFLFAECRAFVQTVKECISGESRCKTFPHVNSSVSPTTKKDNISMPISTSSKIATTPVYSKIIVALGNNGLNDVEVIDLLSSETTCKNLQNFPYANSAAVGGLAFQGKPLLCGGKTNQSLCHLYDNGIWKTSVSLNNGRHQFAMTKLPYLNGSENLFLVGGYGEAYQNSSEVLLESGWQVSVPLPVKIAWHCMVTIGTTTAMVIGGIQNGKGTPNTFLFNSERNVWTEGPSMSTTRASLSCSLIQRNSMSKEKSVIAVGGDDGLISFNSVEVLDYNSDAWRMGPVLPFGINGAAMVEDPTGGVVLIGGYHNGIFLKKLYKLSHAGSDANWVEMTQTLKTPRRYHTAMLVPDHITNCN